ncbi:MAG TPA: hypothetical protein VMW10_08395 [Alphaproteobacteria bacterium]|nr:hypothetical protein [Alphaproteobacteria bacterium]
MKRIILTIALTLSVVSQEVNAQDRGKEFTCPAYIFSTSLTENYKGVDFSIKSSSFVNRGEESTIGFSGAGFGTDGSIQCHYDDQIVLAKIDLKQYSCVINGTYALCNGGNPKNCVITCRPKK